MVFQYINYMVNKNFSMLHLTLVIILFVNFVAKRISLNNCVCVCLKKIRYLNISKSHSFVTKLTIHVIYWES